MRAFNVSHGGRQMGTSGTGPSSDSIAISRLPGTVAVNVYFHVIISNAGEGNIADSMLDQQIVVLNDSYAGLTGAGSATTPYQFVKVWVDRTVNDAWFNAGPGASAEKEMKKALRKGTCKDLNLYTNSGGGYLGWAYYPWDCSKRFTDDGVVVLYAYR